MKRHHGRWGMGSGAGSINSPQRKEPKSGQESPMKEIEARLIRFQLKDLFFQLKDDISEVREEAIRKLGKILKDVKKEHKEEIILNLSKMVSDKVHVSETAIDILVEAGPGAVFIFLKGLDSKDYWPMATAMRALGRMKGDAEEAVPKLIMFLDSKDDTTKCGAITTLGKIGTKAIAALPRLKKMAEHNRNAAIRTFSKIAIEGITGEYPNEIPEWQPCSD